MNCATDKTETQAATSYSMCRATPFGFSAARFEIVAAGRNVTVDNGGVPTSDVRSQFRRLVSSIQQWSKPVGKFWVDIYAGNEFSFRGGLSPLYHAT